MEHLELWRLFRNIALKKHFIEQDSNEIASEAIFLWRTTNQKNVIYCVIDAIRKIYGQGTRGNWLKMERRFSALNDEIHGPETGAVASNVINTDMMDLQKIAKSLPPLLGEVLAMRFAGYTMVEIAKHQGVSVQTVWQRWWKVLRGAGSNGQGFRS